MPRASTAARSVQFSIPIRLIRGSRRGGDTGGSSSSSSSDDEDGDLSCHICANSFCEDDECCRSMTHLACCTQALCTACLVKSSMRCTCKEDCDAVISMCPFCRQVSPVEVLDMFLGGKPVCKRCVEDERCTVAAAAVPVAAAAAAAADDLLPAAG